MAEDNVKAQMRKGILEYCILAILSREDSYAPKTACLLANRKYNKNNHPEDIKSHQYIISFDPRDAVEKIGRAHV